MSLKLLRRGCYNERNRPFSREGRIWQTLLFSDAKGKWRASLILTSLGHDTNSLGNSPGIIYPKNVIKFSFQHCLGLFSVGKQIGIGRITMVPVARRFYFRFRLQFKSFSSLFNFPENLIVILLISCSYTYFYHVCVLKIFNKYPCTFHSELRAAQSSRHCAGPQLVRIILKTEIRPRHARHIITPIQVAPT